MKKIRWFTEKFSPYEAHSHAYTKVIKRKKTKFQELLILDTLSFGRCLILDGEIQSALKDEKIYHEILVHPAMGYFGKPSSVLILGGGEGATLREVLRWRTVKHVTMVDIDRETVEFCKKYLKQWHQNSFYDRRVNLVFEDARNFLKNSTEKWDVIIMDLPCPLEGGPAYKLYAIEYIKELNSHLNKGGVFVSQAGGASITEWHFHLAFYATLKKVFKNVLSYNIFVPSFDLPWAFLLAYNGLKKSRQKVFSNIKRNTKGRFYCINKEILESLGANPEYFQQALEKSRKIITMKKPVFYFK